ncbi:uncharacterized mitochondrial protein AtMg00810-like [Pyrus x bretschneideri]|uniref:uncharacterized mitochondrial protein AtMg00810-like n=1 Tax=Pyrus x bretschneideri TaxID=225117 RepID=UPI00202DE138|nr:uncharacterized mitochondrial protein AtMg00810-like [Pyrus x bretschneideri]
MTISHEGLFLGQRKYMVDLLTEASLIDCKPAITPIDSKMKPNLTGKPLTNISYYQRLVGKLFYVTITRPYITDAVSLVNQFMHALTMQHFQLVKRILCYLKASLDIGILMSNNQSTKISAYADADWACSIIDRKSTIGYCTFVEGNLVTWKVAMHIAANPVFLERTKHIEVDYHFIQALKENL